MAQLVDIIPAQCILGEGIVWNPWDGAIWWTDIHGRKLWRHVLGGNSTTYSLPERLCAFAFTPDQDKLFCAFESGFGTLSLSTLNIDWLVRPELGETGRRFNDGRMDRFGNFFTGTMVENEALAGPNSASLYSVSPAGKLTRHMSDIQISNGLCWSMDNRTLYFADSPKRHIYAFDYDGATSQLSNKRLFVETPKGAFPDGAVIDAEDCLWSAHWGAGQVVRYAPDGALAQVIAIPASQPTCVAFGGPDMSLLFVSSAREGLRDIDLDATPHAGDVFVYQLDVAGLSEIRYEGT